MNTINNSQTTVFLIIHGIIAILIGLIFAFASEVIFKWIVLSIGILLILSGVLMIWKSYKENKLLDANKKYISLFLGIFLIAIGLFISINLTSVTSIIIFIFGVWAIISGGSQVFYSIKGRKNLKYNKLFIINGLLTIIIGLIMTINQELFIDIIGKVVGFSIIIVGITTLIFAGFFHSGQKNLESD